MPRNKHNIQASEVCLPDGRPIDKLPRGMGRAAAFTPLKRGNFPEVRRISSAAFPDEFRYFQNGGLKSLLKEPGADRFSFMITDSVTDRPSGYCIAYYKRLVTKQHDPTSLYVDHFAISPEDQGCGFGLQGLHELLRRVELDGLIDNIDMYARKDTAYRAIMAHQDIIRAAGYEVEDFGDEYDPNELYEGIFAFEEESAYHLVLRRLPDLVWR